MSRFWVVAAAMCVAFTAAAAPSTLNVEGQLIGSDGVPLMTGTFTLSVGLYDSAEAAGPVFAETQANVDVMGSVFGMTLGTDLINPLTADMFAQADNLWVGVTIISGPGIDDPQPELPRAPLGAAPYAYAAHRLVCDACIAGNHIAPAAVTGSHIAPATITASHLAPGSVVSGFNSATGDVHLAAGAGIELDTTGSTITISATGMMGGGEPGAGVPTLTAATLGTLTVADDDIVRVQGTITVTSDINLFNKDRLHVHGGEFEGTGAQEIDLGSDTVVTGTGFKDLVLDGNSITFIGCTFSGAIGFPFGSRIYSSELNGVTASGRIDLIHGSEVDNSTLPRIRAITDSDLSNVTVAGTQLNAQEMGYMANNRVDDSTIYMRSGTRITGNNLDNSHIRVVSDGGRGLMVIANNNFDDLLDGQTEAIQVDLSTSNFWSLQITGNNFIVQSGDPQAIKITGQGAATYHLLTIRGNNFMKGGQAISYAGTIKTVVDGNTTRQATLGVSAGGQLQLGTNFAF